MERVTVHLQAVGPDFGQRKAREGGQSLRAGCNF